ncbi:hypothetical protein K490DRAFT_52231 [Saccharata proteae CBS 121410]|uniref:C2H2-type domain-containing protein n=1 Tax=Saccharata proteae CBS 121410 TaxID=1314787 RepID=A0A9P4HKG3_9PEZI|nr:hypothetical protein K490DRAFT_52231 [Saccharata proteae CBS 121410]
MPPVRSTPRVIGASPLTLFQRTFTNPAPKTESAREARRAFFCELCQKGYARMNEFEAHEASYDHQHKKRLKDMKQISKDPMAAEKARRAERKAEQNSGLISFKPVKLDSGSTAGAGFKKGGFKSAKGFKKAFAVDEEKVEEKKVEKKIRLVDDDEESETEEFGYQYYDPRKPTDCHPGCAGIKA